MEVQDGFILSIFNYCDRWCETCPFTSRCHVFADCAEHEAALDPMFKALVEAPQHPQDVRVTPSWLEDVIEEMNKAAESGEPLPEPAPLPQSYVRICERANAYGMRVHEWLTIRGDDDGRDPGHPLAVVGWFCHLIGAKVHRALTGLAEFDGDRQFPPDHEGSAKVALIGIDRSLVAWQDLISIARITSDDAAPLLAELTSLKSSLEELIPRARAFVRPGFDEPHEVRKLEASGV